MPDADETPAGDGVEGGQAAGADSLAPAVTFPPGRAHADRHAHAHAHAQIARKRRKPTVRGELKRLRAEGWIDDATYAAVLEYQGPHIEVRFAEALLPKVANGIDLDWNLRRSHAENRSSRET